MKEIVDGLKGLAKNSNKITKLINDYLRLKENSSENAYVMEKKLSAISKVTTNLPDFNLKVSINDWLKKEKQELEKAKEDFRFNFGEKLKTLFQNGNRQIKGQYPTLRIGFYTLKLNFEFGEAMLYFGPEVEKIKSKIALEPATIYQTLKKYDDKLKAYKFEPKEFLNDLYTAYKKRLIISNKSSGEKLLLVDVLNEFVLLKQPPQFFIDPKKENFREFSRVKLSYLLYLLRKYELDSRGLKFYVATFDATVDKRHAIWIPESEEGEGTYYSYISFEKL